MKLPPPTPLMIDSRTGSKELVAPLLRLGTPHELTTLQYGDVAFVGHGPDGLTPVGVERKGIRDLAQSLVSQRLTGYQLPGLLEAYPFAWLIVEGAWRVGDEGYVEIPIGRGTWKELQPRLKGESLLGWLFSVELRGGIRVRTTRSLEDTAIFITALHQWWTSKTWAEHKSHLALWQPPDASIFDQPSVVRRWAAILPGIGQDKSKAVEQMFATPFELANADERDWRRIKGVGKTLSENIVRIIMTGR